MMMSIRNVAERLRSEAENDADVVKVRWKDKLCDGESSAGNRWSEASPSGAASDIPFPKTESLYNQGSLRAGSRGPQRVEFRGFIETIVRRSANLETSTALRPKSAGEDCRFRPILSLKKTYCTPSSDQSMATVMSECSRSTANKSLICESAKLFRNEEDKRESGTCDKHVRFDLRDCGDDEKHNIPATVIVNPQKDSTELTNAGRELVGQQEDEQIDEVSIRLLMSVSKELSRIQAKKNRIEKSLENERNFEYLFSISRILSEMKSDDEKQREI